MPAASESQQTTLDPMDLMNTTARLAQANLDLWMRAFTSPPPIEGDPLKVRGAGLKFASGLMKNPKILYDVQTQMWSDFMELSACMMGSGDCTAEEQKLDRRFRDPAWDDNPLFSCIKQSYFIAAKGIHTLVSEGGDLDPQARGRLMFATQQMIDALSPSNFVFTNPHVLQKAMDTQGKSLIDGVNHLLNDLERNPGRFDISMVEADAFELGVNIATTPGQVVFQNELMELIQYSPSTDKVNRRPLLVVPPWMNKYYILDMRPDNSYLKWLVDQGHSVFVISWINPDKEHAKKGIDDYMIEGPLAALEAIEQATGEEEVNVIGYCLGGILLSATMAWMAAKGDQRIKSATLLTTMVDFAEPGDVDIFISDDGLDEITDAIHELGYLDGRAVYDTFRSLRANDLIWSFYVNNYLLGNPPGNFDLLHWNADATNMPAAIHTFCMHKLYRANLLREPGGINVAGVDIDVSQIKTPTYVLSAQDDHIAPWRTTYSTPHLFSGPVKFVLSESGHIAGVVNPPAKNKYGYWVKGQYPSDPQQWLDAATHHEGSWWPDWARWAKPKGGGKVNARQPGDGKLQCIEAAPGSYVKRQI